jgi:hypothetical protein
MLRINVVRRLSGYEVANGSGIGKQHCNRVLPKEPKFFAAAPAESPSAWWHADIFAACGIAKAKQVRLWRVPFLSRERPLGAHLQ